MGLVRRAREREPNCLNVIALRCQLHLGLHSLYGCVCNCVVNILHRCVRLTNTGCYSRMDCEALARLRNRTHTHKSENTPGQLSPKEEERLQRGREEERKRGRENTHGMKRNWQSAAVCASGFVAKCEKPINTLLHEMMASTLENTQAGEMCAGASTAQSMHTATSAHAHARRKHTKWILLLVVWQCNVVGGGADRCISAPTQTTST